MKKIYFAEAITIDNYLYEKYNDEADGMTHRDLTDEEFISLSTGIGYEPMTFFKEFNNGWQVPDPDNFFCRVIEEEKEKGFINYYQKMRDIEEDCRLQVMSMLEKTNGVCEFDTENNIPLILPYYDINGETTNVAIEKVEITTTFTNHKTINIYTEHGRCCRISEFADNPIIFIYEKLYETLNPTN